MAKPTPTIAYGKLQLTEIEIRCLKLRAEGLLAKQIGNIVNIPFRTVESYFSTARERNNCKSSYELIAIFARVKISVNDR